MRIDINWRNHNCRSWRSIWNEAGEETGQIECANDGYRAVVNGTVGPWMDRLYEAIERFKQMSTL